MPKYNLVVKYTDGVKYNILWNKLFMETEYDLNSLMYIDYFTSRYKDKRELMKVIEFFELVEERDIKKWIRIEYKNAGCVKEAQVIYKDDLKFFNIEYLTKYILLKYKDVKFLEYLVHCFHDNPIQSKNIEVFKTYINKSNHGFYARGFDFTIDEQNNINSLLDFITRQIYKYDNKTQSYLYNEDGTPMVHYKPYRDFAKVISNYSRKFDKKEQIDLFESTHFKNTDINSSLKTLIRKKILT